MKTRLSWTVVLLALASSGALASGCRWRRRGVVVARRAPPPPPPLFTRADAPPLAVRAWVSQTSMLAPFVATVDGWAAVLVPAGTVRWTTARNGAPVARETASPCRFDASRHATYWALAPRIALDGRGHACCVHDGDAAAPAGAYCADLRAPAPRWSRARTRDVPEGAGSGDGAIALFARDVWCTTDGGAHISATFRGDLEQALSLASCSARGYAVAVGGARSFGSERLQTLRAGHESGSLAMVPGSPRGQPVDARALDDGSVHALLVGPEGPRYVYRAPDGAVATLPLPGATPGRALGQWGRAVAVLAPLGEVLAVEGAAPPRRRTLDTALATSVLAATRVGRDLVAVTRDGTFAILPRD